MMEWLLNFLSRLFGTSGKERPSPQDIVPESSIEVLPDGFFINTLELNIPFTEAPIIWIPGIPDTNSMDGLLDIGHNVILIKGKNLDHETLVYALKVGDIAVFHCDRGSIIHRIIEIGRDSYGRYFKFKGDNNATADPETVRDNQIDWLCIGIIY